MVWWKLKRSIARFGNGTKTRRCHVVRDVSITSGFGIENWAWNSPSTSTMALPQTLRSSVTPPELELVASQQLIEIVPLISMEKTAFISVQFLVNQPVQDWLIQPSRVHMGLSVHLTKRKFRYGLQLISN
jgi:hypothetical protein